VLTASIIIALMMEAASTSETSVNFYQTTWCNILEDSHLQGSLALERCKFEFTPSSMANQGLFTVMTDATDVQNLQQFYHFPHLHSDLNHNKQTNSVEQLIGFS
jgi:hypothetical protein